MDHQRMTAVEAGHPSHIVVFKQPSEANEEILRAAFSIKSKRGKTSSPGTRLLSAPHSGGSITRVFSRLGAAAIDLNDDDVAMMKKDAAVAGVYPNELQMIPTPPREETPVKQAVTKDPMVAYLQGMRDAAEAALRFAGVPTGISPSGPGVLGAPAAAPPPLQSSNLEWHLQMVLQAGSCSTGQGVKLAVLDTGLDLDHPDFAGRVDDEHAKSFIDGETVQDGNGHGTHCCGLAAGKAMPSVMPRYGVAPAVELLVGKVLSDEGSGWDDGILEGMEWAIDQGARIISMSLGSGRSEGEPYRQLYENIARSVYDFDDGALIIAAAGNSSYRPWYRDPVGNPAASPSIVAVAAIDSERKVADFSCAQMDQIGILDISAPGVNTRSSWPGGGYKSISGTSMATPIVAGCAALILEQQPSLTPRQLRERLLASALPLGQRSDYGEGLVQAP